MCIVMHVTLPAALHIFIIVHVTVRYQSWLSRMWEKGKCEPTELCCHPTRLMILETWGALEQVYNGWQYSETTNGTNRMHDGPQNSCCLCELPFARNQSVVFRKGRKKTCLLPSTTCVAVFWQGIWTVFGTWRVCFGNNFTGVPAFDRTQVMLWAAKVWFILGSYLHCSASLCVSLFVALSLGFCFRGCRWPTQHALVEGLGVKVWPGSSLTRLHTLVIGTVPPVHFVQDGSSWAPFVADSIAVSFVNRIPFCSRLFLIFSPPNLEKVAEVLSRTPLFLSCLSGFVQHTLYTFIFEIQWILLN